MRFLRNVFFFLAAVVISGSCGRDTSVLYLVVTPDVQFEEGVAFVNSGAQLRFNVEVFSTEGTVGKLCVRSFDEENGNVDHAALELGRKEYRGDYVCTVPIVQNEADMNFLFTADDSAGNESSFNVRVRVRPSGISQLTEHSGISLYPGNSEGRADAFDLKSCQPVIREEGTAADIIATIDGGTVSLSSATDVLFVSAASFDYSSATFSGISSLFRSSIRSSSVTGISEDDIIVVGRLVSDAQQGTEMLVPVGVMKFIVVTEGRLVFNFKS